MRELVSRCDICGSDENVGTFRVTIVEPQGNDEDWEVEICDKTDGRHSKPIRVLVQKGRRSLSGAGAKPPRAGLQALESRIRGVPSQLQRREA